MKISDLAYSPEHRSWLDSYLLYRDPEPLIKAIRDGNPELLTSKIVLEFIADIVEGKQVLPASGYVDKNNVNRNTQIVRKLWFYNGANIPIKRSLDLGVLSCCSMVSEEFGLSEDYIYKTIWKKSSVSIKKSELENLKVVGRAIYICNNESVPASLDNFYEILDILLSKNYETLLDQAQEAIRVELIIKWAKKEKIDPEEQLREWRTMPFPGRNSLHMFPLYPHPSQAISLPVRANSLSNKE